jgi:hypothetical protein
MRITAKLAPRQSLWGRSISPCYITQSHRLSSYIVPMWLIFTYCSCSTFYPSLSHHMSAPFVFKWCSVHLNKALYLSPVPLCELPHSLSFPPRLPSPSVGATWVSLLLLPRHFADVLSLLMLSLCLYPVFH